LGVRSIGYCSPQQVADSDYTSSFEAAITGLLGTDCSSVRAISYKAIAVIVVSLQPYHQDLSHHQHYHLKPQNHAGIWQNG
jgi:hypothetical protein